ncbi:polysaccharide deacetylase family protein [Natronococcus occultus]|uniref:Putative xylanase/chitin deacetylase n=1 Tax=Natronococcus occultus SP4 TaxID=694430 RepID=L0K1Q0_9EURY|nr:polysaccharide deacetylase family protein [Natronococcus occultus]AGB38475.1 putative xylanase/chitin deacetylase [Natronococcus occultus SP4]
MHRRNVLAMAATGAVGGIATSYGGVRRTDDHNAILGSEGLVVFTYDDSPIEDYTLTYQVHQEYDVPGCVAACPGWMEDDTDFLDPDQLAEMDEDGWGVLSHTYRHRALGYVNLNQTAAEGDERVYVDVHRHGDIAEDPLAIFDEENRVSATVAGQGTDSGGDYIELEEPLDGTVDSSGVVRHPAAFIRDRLEKTDERLESWGFDVTGFVYPYGRYHGVAEEIVREHYGAVANHRYGGGHNELPGQDPTAMRRRYIETDRADEDEIDAFMQTAAAEDVLAIVGGHSQYDTLTEDRIRYTIEAALERDLAIVTIEEALEALGPRIG